jgi:hypothetical protein
MLPSGHFVPMKCIRKDKKKMLSHKGEKKIEDDQLQEGQEAEDGDRD